MADTVQNTDTTIYLYDTFHVSRRLIGQPGYGEAVERGRESARRTVGDLALAEIERSGPAHVSLEWEKDFDMTVEAERHMLTATIRRES